MRQLRVFALAVQLTSLISGAIFGWLLWEFVRDSALTFDGPRPYTSEHFLELDRWTQLALISVAVFFVLSCAGFFSALALYRGHNSGRIGVTVVMITALVMASIDWVLEGVGRDVVTLAVLAATVVFSVWMLFIKHSIAGVFTRADAAREAGSAIESGR